MNKAALYWIDPDSPADHFPPTTDALSQPDGLLCLGGDLSEARLLSAYKRGIFPWYSEGQPIMWWCPSPRCVIYPDELIIRRSLRKVMRNAGYSFSMDQAFGEVIRACAAPRIHDKDGNTWITTDMQLAYIHMHQQGHAHSVEIWKGDRLVGGLYGIAIGRVFFGESMFSNERDTSKIALACLTQHLKRYHFRLIDTQVASAHLLSLGASQVDRETFSSELEKHCHMEKRPYLWQTDQIPVKDSIFK